MSHAVAISSSSALFTKTKLVFEIRNVINSENIHEYIHILAVSLFKLQC